MSVTTASWILLGLAFVAANLPWMSERIMLVREPGEGGKRFYWRLLEWTILYFVVGAIAFGLEEKLNGNVYHQGWEFYAVTVCLFMVFALPGFIYRHDLRKHLVKS